MIIHSIDDCYSVCASRYIVFEVSYFGTKKYSHCLARRIVCDSHNRYSMSVTHMTDNLITYIKSILMISTGPIL